MVDCKSFKKGKVAVFVNSMFTAWLCPVFLLDRARVVGGLPDVVAIQEGKVNKLDIHFVFRCHSFETSLSTEG